MAKGLKLNVRKSLKLFKLFKMVVKKKSVGGGRGVISSPASYIGLMIAQLMQKITKK